MASILIILTLLFGVLAYTYVAPTAKARRRMKRLEKARNEALKNVEGNVAHEQRKTALNIPGYYEDIVNKDKLQKTYKWELHDSI